MFKQYYVYIMSSHSKRLYIGMTSDLHRRVAEHKQGLVEGFTKRYNLKMLVYYETANDVRAAIEREKYVKGMEAEQEDGADRVVQPRVG